jgi:hypothetical protein
MYDDTLLSRDGWRGVDRSHGMLTGAETPRARWFAALLIVAAAAVGWVGSGHMPFDPPPPPPPATATISDSDGLPAELRLKQRYSARFQITFPADWPAQSDYGADATPARFLLVGPWTPGVEEEAALPSDAALRPGQDVIYCTEAVLAAAGRQVDVTCEITPKVPGPLRLTLHVTTGFLDMGDNTRTASRAFHHTVR